MKETKHHELRQLVSKDIFKMSRIIKGIGFNKFKEVFSEDSVRRIIASNKGKENISELVGMSIGMDIVGIIIDNLPNVAEPIYSFLEDLSGISAEEIKELPMDEFMQMIVDVIKKEEFGDFIRVVSGLFSKVK